jgi:hypothetical protein
VNPPVNSYAYIFAGRYEERILLGVGTINSVNDIPGTVIASDTRRVNFIICALTNNVTDNPLTSTFLPAAWVVHTIDVNNRDIPVFMFPADITTNVADFSINCAIPDLLETIVYAGNGLAIKEKYISQPYVWPDSIDVLPVDLAGVTFTDAFAPDTVLTALPGGPITIGLEIDTTDPNGAGGLCLLSIEIPVRLKTGAAAANMEEAKTWFLRGGLNNTLIDIGYDNIGLGGAVIIGIYYNFLYLEDFVGTGTWQPDPVRWIDPPLWAVYESNTMRCDYATTGDYWQGLGHNLTLDVGAIDASGFTRVKIRYKANRTGDGYTFTMGTTGNGAGIEMPFTATVLDTWEERSWPLSSFTTLNPANITSWTIGIPGNITVPAGTSLWIDYIRFE